MLQNWSERKKGLTAAFITAGTWSALAILLKFGLKYADSPTIVWYRFTVAFISILLWTLFKQRGDELKVLLAKPGKMTIAALSLGFNYLGYMQGVHYSSPANTQIFVQIGPLLLALSGLFFFKESLSKKQLAGFAACILGFSLFFYDRLNINLSQQNQLMLGLTWTIFAAVAWAIYATLQKSLVNQWKNSQINLYIYLCCSLIFAAFVDWSTLISLPLSVHLLYVFLGLNTTIAYGFLTVALKFLPATQVSPILTMNPLLTLLFIWVIDTLNLGFIPRDPVSLIGYIGAFVALFGVRTILLKSSGPSSSKQRN